MICVAGSRACSTRATPSSVPPSRSRDEIVSGSSWKSARISRAVVRDVDVRVGLVLELAAEDQPCVFASSMAFASMPLPFSDAGVSTTFAPRKAQQLAPLDAEVSAMTQTSG
jgi:hypothetical protein